MAFVSIIDYHSWTVKGNEGSLCLGKKALYILWGLYLAFTAYASLVYGDAGASGRGDGHLLFNIFPIPSLQHLGTPDTVKDMALNLLFYLPLGILTAGAFTKERPRYLRPWCCFGFVLSLALEFTQSFTGRYPSLSDIGMNTLGHALGYLGAVFSMRRYRVRPTDLLSLASPDSRLRALSALRFLYLFVHGFVSLYPFDISFRGQDLYRQFLDNDEGPRRVVLDPSYHFTQGDWLSPNWVLVFLGYLPALLLTGVIQHLENKASLAGVVLFGVAWSVLVETAQMLIQSQTTDIFCVFLAAGAGVGAWALSRAWRYSSAGRDEPGAKDRHPLSRQRIKLSLVAYIVFLCLVSWAPYQFELTPDAIWKSITDAGNWTPFKHHLAYHSIGNAVDLMKEMGVFLPFGLLVAMLLRNALYRTSTRLLATGAICCGLSFCLELTQAACIGRYFDITDSIMATVGGILGAFVARPRRA
jgi:glycopeptide antibiotics resistance protein